ncbi:MAG: hypothetical protein WDO74_13205 [Pseudomonadota bacterium]
MADMPREYRKANDAASESGITAAAINDARSESMNANSTSVTSVAPSAKFSKDGLERGVDELGAVVKRLDFDVGRQRMTQLRDAFA